MKTRLLTALALALFVSVPAQAAYITIDDSDVNTITISAGDFEQGFYVNGTLLTIGLGSGGSITLADGSVDSYSGSWIDLGATTAGNTNHFFGLGTEVYSGIESSASTDGFYGSIVGAFAGFDLGSSYGPNPATRPQDGSAVDFSRPYLSARFISEVAAVPEPGPIALLGAGLLCMALMRRKRAAGTRAA